MDKEYAPRKLLDGAGPPSRVRPRRLLRRTDVPGRRAIGTLAKSGRQLHGPFAYSRRGPLRRRVKVGQATRHASISRKGRSSRIGPT